MSFEKLATSIERTSRQRRFACRRPLHHLPPLTCKWLFPISGMLRASVLQGCPATAKKNNHQADQGSFMRRLLACLALAGLSLSAQAIPVTYDLTFTAITGPSGSGELTWDSAASSMTGFSWDFGAGRQGGVLDSVLAEIAEGGPIGALLWEVLTGEDTHPFVFFSPSGSVGIFSAGFTAGSTYPVVAAYFFVNDEYHFVPASGPEDTGIVTLAQRATVPEPSMLTLLAFGLAGIGFTRFRRRSQPA